MNHWGVSPCCTGPPVAEAHHRIVANTPRSATASYPHPPNPPRSSGVTIVGPTTAIATHNLARPLYQEGRDTIDICCASGPDIATVWTCPTPVYTHTARRCTNNTHRARAIVPCALRRPTCPQSNTIGRNQAGYNHSSANTLGPVHHMARTHQTDDKSKGRGKKGAHQQRVLC